MNSLDLASADRLNARLPMAQGMGMIDALINQEPELAGEALRLKNKLDIIERDSKLTGEYRLLKEKLNAIEHDFKIMHQKIKEQPGLAGEAKSIQNRMDAIWYCSRLLSPESANPEEIEKSIRFVVESDVQDKYVENIFEAFWKDPGWLLFFPESLGRGLLMSKALHKIRESSILSRPAGARGDVLTPASMAADRGDLVQQLLHWYKGAAEEAQGEIALTLGEWGGEAEAQVLHEWFLEAMNSRAEAFKLIASVLSALANIGGPTAVDTLLEAAGTAPKRIAVTALGSLEFLASGGSAALTELPEPPVIDTLELWNAYDRLSHRLMKIANLSTVDEYVQYKAEELVEIIRPALRKRPAA